MAEHFPEGTSDEPEPRLAREPVLKTGQICSATVLVEDDTLGEWLKGARMGNWPVVRPPGYETIQVDLARVVDVVADEDGQPLYYVQPVVTELLHQPPEIIGRTFLVEEGQMFPADLTDLMDYTISELTMVVEGSLTRGEILSRLRQILVGLNCDPE